MNPGSSPQDKEAQERCPTCGSEVEIHGHTTKYFVPKSRELPTNSQTEEEMAAVLIGQGRVGDINDTYSAAEVWKIEKNACILGLRRGAEAEREKFKHEEGSWVKASLSLDAQLAAALAEIASLKAELEAEREKIRKEFGASNCKAPSRDVE